jgi:ligand-binding sensor domain-containing protein
MKIKKLSLIIFVAGLLFAVQGPVLAQEEAWRSYPEITAIYALAADGDTIWVGTDAGLLRRQRSDGTYRRYTTADGLPHNQVNTVTVDDAGQVWIGTAGGVSHFDGTTWATYTTTDGLLDNDVRAIVLDGEGQVWVGTAGGVSRFDGTTWTTYTTTDGLLNNDVRAIALNDAGQVWIGTGGGVSRFDGTTWTNYTTADGLLNNDVHAITLDDTGQVWIGTAGGVSHFDGTSWTNYTGQNELLNDTVWAIAVEDYEHLWLGVTGGATEFERTIRAIYPLGHSKTPTRAIAIDADGHKWFGGEDGVLHEFDGDEWKSYPPFGQITAIAFGLAGDAWIGSAGDGLAHFDGKTWTIYSTAVAANLLSDQVHDITIDALGQVWVSTPQGVSRYNGSIWQNYANMNGLVSDNVQAIAVDAQGRQWFATIGGQTWWDWQTNNWGGGQVSMLEGENWTNYSTNDGLINENVYQVAAAPDGAIWFGTRAGLSRFDGAAWLNYTTDNGLPHNWVTALAVATDGRVWVGTAGGVALFDGENWTTYTAADGLSSNLIYDIAVAPDGQVWVGSSGGLSRFDGEKWINYTPDGGKGRRVTTVAVGPDGGVWLGFAEAGGGVAIFDETLGVTLPAPPRRVTEQPLPTPARAVVTGPRLFGPDRIYALGRVAGVTQTLTLELTPEGETIRSMYSLAGKLALDGERDRLYIDHETDGLAVIHTQTGQMRTLVPLPPARIPPPAPQVDPVSGRVLAFRDSVVYIVDPEAGRVVETLSTAQTDVQFCDSSTPNLGSISNAAYDSAEKILYLQFQTYYPCDDSSDTPAYRVVSYDLATGEQIASQSGAFSEPATFEGHLYYPDLTDGREAPVNNGYYGYEGDYYYDPYYTPSPPAGKEPLAPQGKARLLAWEGGEPWLTISGWDEAGGPFYVDPARRRLYQTTPGGYLRAFDADTMALLLRRPAPGELVGYDTANDRLYFLAGEELLAVRGQEIEPPSPPPLAASEPPTTPVRSLIIVEQGQFGLWEAGRLYTNRDGVWMELGDSLGYVTALALSPDGETLLAGVAGLGVFRSTDGGQSWQPFSAGLTHMNVTELLTAPGVAFIRLAEGGYYHSTDGGQSWKPFETPAEGGLVLSPEFEQDHTLLSWGGRTRLYLTRYGGEVWRFAGLLPGFTRQVSLAPQQTIFAYGFGNNRESLYRSTDGGWSNEVVLRQKFTIEQMLYTPGPNYSIFLLTHTQNKIIRPPIVEKAIYRSADEGRTWGVVPLPASVTPTTLAVSPAFTEDQTLFVGTETGEVITLRSNAN